MTALLTVREVKAGYGRVQILNGISIELPTAGNIGLFGPNGHGKTTLLRTISGLVRCHGGSISFDGNEITGRNPSKIIDLGLIHVPQGNVLFPNLKISETLQLGAHRAEARRNYETNLALATEIFPKLRERWHQRVSTLSGGERQMVSIAMALMNQPRALILDEPTLGLAPKVKEELCQAISSISERGIPLIVVEQDIEFLMQLTKTLYLISHGETKAELSSDNQPDHREIMEMYFGM